MKNKINIGGLFYNNKFAIGFSLITSFVIWIFVASSSYAEQEKVISDIPISIPLSDVAQNMGLKIFSGEEEKAEVKISGNRVSVGMVSKDNIQVIAKQASSSIVSPGTYTLELTAIKKGTFTDYEFSSAVTPSFVTVTVDTTREINMNITDEVKYNFDPNYFAAATSFSDTNVSISGPESKIKTISKVSAKKDVEETLKSTWSAAVPLTVYDSFGADISKDPQIQLSVEEVTVIIPVLFVKKVPIVPEFANAPENFKIDSSFSSVQPHEIEIAGPEETVKNLSDIKLKPLDFSKINLQNKLFDLDLNLPNGCRTMNNVYSAKLTINMDNMKSTSVKVNNIKFINIPQNKTPRVYTDSITVQMIGHENAINSLNSDNVFAEIDLKDQQYFVGTKEMPVKIHTKTKSGCWAYGEFTANVGIE